MPPGQRGRPSPASDGPPGGAAPSYLMAQHQDLRVLRRLAAAHQDQPAEHPGYAQIQQTHRHELRSCPTRPTTPNRSSATLRRVLEQYTPVSWSVCVYDDSLGVEIPRAHHEEHRKVHGAQPLSNAVDGAAVGACLIPG